MTAFDKLKGFLRQDVSALARSSRLRASLSASPEEAQIRLWEAVEAQDVAGTQKALRDGAHPCQCSAQGVSALHVVARSGNVSLMSVLLSSPLAHASLDERSAQGFSALSDAAAAGSAGCVALLLDAGADPSFKGPRGVSVLHRAAAQDNAEVLRLLFKAGADWNGRDVDGVSPLDVLAQHRPHAVNAWRRRAQQSGSN